MLQQNRAPSAATRLPGTYRSRVSDMQSAMCLRCGSRALRHDHFPDKLCKSSHMRHRHRRWEMDLDHLDVTTAFILNLGTPSFMKALCCSLVKGSSMPRSQRLACGASSAQSWPVASPENRPGVRRSHGERQFAFMHMWHLKRKICHKGRDLPFFPKQRIPFLFQKMEDRSLQV